jgi:hypothetical protein
LHYNPAHSAASQLEYDSQHATSNVGLSHVAQGRAVRHNGRDVVESIYGVKSVDLVTDPATTHSLHESFDCASVRRDCYTTFIEARRAEANCESASEFAASLRGASAKLLRESTKYAEALRDRHTSPLTESSEPTSASQYAASLRR